MKRLQVGIAQLNSTENVDENVEKCKQYIDQALAVV